MTYYPQVEKTLDYVREHKFTGEQPKLYVHDKLTYIEFDRHKKINGVIINRDGDLGWWPVHLGNAQGYATAFETLKDAVMFLDFMRYRNDKATAQSIEYRDQPL